MVRPRRPAGAEGQRAEEPVVQFFPVAAVDQFGDALFVQAPGGGLLASRAAMFFALAGRSLPSRAAASIWERRADMETGWKDNHGKLNRENGGV